MCYSPIELKRTTHGESCHTLNTYSVGVSSSAVPIEHTYASYTFSYLYSKPPPAGMVPMLAFLSVTLSILGTCVIELAKKKAWCSTTTIKAGGR